MIFLFLVLFMTGLGLLLKGTKSLKNCRQGRRFWIQRFGTVLDFKNAIPLTGRTVHTVNGLYSHTTCKYSGHSVTTVQYENHNGLTVIGAIREKESTSREITVSKSNTPPDSMSVGVARKIGEELPIVYDTRQPEKIEFGTLSGRLGKSIAAITFGALFLIGAILSLVGVAMEK